MLFRLLRRFWRRLRRREDTRYICGGSRYTCSFTTVASPSERQSSTKAASRLSRTATSKQERGADCLWLRARRDDGYLGGRRSGRARSLGTATIRVV